MVEHCSLGWLCSVQILHNVSQCLAEELDDRNRDLSVRHALLLLLLLLRFALLYFALLCFTSLCFALILFYFFRGHRPLPAGWEGSRPRAKQEEEEVRTATRQPWDVTWLDGWLVSWLVRWLVE